MDMKQLEVFTAVVENNSFSRAAQCLHLTQPTVSAHIAALERELQVKLIVRTTKELYPSDAGRLLYRYAKQLLSLREEAQEAIWAYREEMAGTVTLAASTIPGQYFLPRLLQDFREKYPDIRFELRMVDSAEAVAAVAARTVEIGFCGTLVDSPKCIFQEFARDRLVIITPNTEKYRRFQRTGFPIRQITEESFISREKGSGTRKETELFLREMGVDVSRLQVTMEVHSTDSIRRMVAQGLGIAVMSRAASAADCQAHRLLAFDFDSVSLRRKLYLVRQKNGILSPVAQAFYDFAKEYYKK